MSIKKALYSSQQYVSFLNNGEERALDYFYTCYYEALYIKARMATGDVDISRTFVQEAFFRLWLFREHIHSFETVQSFLEDEIRRAIREYYSNPSEQFRRNFVPLQPFHIDGSQSSMDELENDQPSDKQDPEDRMYIKKINALMPHLRQDQQRLIRLCLEYSFNYDRIAKHLGGRSSQEVRLRAERAIAHMRSVFENTEKLQELEKGSMVDQVAMLNSEEALVLHLRFDQQRTFNEIATALDVDIAVANSLFVRAYRKTKLSSWQSEYISMC